MRGLWIEVDLGAQRLELRDAERRLMAFPISSAANGAGERDGSGCTPRGRHRVRARIGAGAAPGTVFVGRRPTGEVWRPARGGAAPEGDPILSRILWLCGCEPGRNRLGAVDTMRRYIYIHGAPDDAPIGEPRSHGCIRMRNADVIALFDAVPVGTPVEIHE